MERLPWEINPDLTEERIKVIADLICTVRTEVVDLHDEQLGDTRLSLGTRAYECCRTRIISLAESQIHTWLGIINQEGRFTFKIGNTPVRFTRNEPDNLPSRKLIVSEEAKQLLFFDIHPELKESEALLWFFVIDTPYKVAVETMYMIGYNQSNEIRCQWEIPIEEMVPFALTLVDPIEPQPVELPPAPVSIKKSYRVTRENNES